MERRIIDLSKYRFGCCYEVLEDTKIMYEAGRYKNVLNRAYYSIFHAIRAVKPLALAMGLYGTFGKKIGQRQLALS